MRQYEGLVCPFCKTRVNLVLDSRGSPRGESTRRRRRKCVRGHRFTTYETIDQSDLLRVTNAAGRSESFDRGKLTQSIQRELADRHSHIAVSIVKEVEDSLRSDGTWTTSPRRVAELVFDHLWARDPASAIRYGMSRNRWKSLDELARWFATIHATSARSREPETPARR